MNSIGIGALQISYIIIIVAFLQTESLVGNIRWHLCGDINMSLLQPAFTARPQPSSNLPILPGGINHQLVLQQSGGKKGGSILKFMAVHRPARDTGTPPCPKRIPKQIKQFPKLI